MKQDFVLWLAAALWTAAMVCGWISLNRYTYTSEAVAAAPSEWPKDAGLTRTKNHPSLVMFLHPGCPCSRATLVELQRLRSRIGEPCDVQLVMVLSREHADDWQETPLQHQASEMKNVHLTQDWDGRIASAFSAGTSGETYLYSPQGKLLFHGGLTLGRGHEGPASGQDQILNAVQSLTPQIPNNKVYGCRLPLPALAQDVVSP